MTTSRLIGQVLGALTFHTVMTVVLGGIGQFIYNFGFSVLGGGQPIEYLTSWAIMVGIYLVGLVANFFHNKHLNAKAQLEMMKVMEMMAQQHYEKTAKPDEE
jgi:mannose/fructose/N-acetylgalactosamine-specific phosphotransferase system component IID